MASGDGTPRTYDVTNPLDIPAGVVNSDSLAAEIADDPGLAAATLDRIDQEGNLVNIYFTAALSAAEIIALDAVLFAHTGTPTSPKFQFWEVNPEASTSSDSLIDAMVRVADPLQAGTYILSWYMELKLTPTGPINSQARALFLIDNNVKGNMNYADDAYSGFCGWDRYRAEAGETPELKLRVRRAGGNDQVDYRKMKLGIVYQSEQDI